MDIPYAIKVPRRVGSALGEYYVHHGTGCDPRTDGDIWVKPDGKLRVVNRQRRWIIAEEGTVHPAFAGVTSHFTLDSTTQRWATRQERERASREGASATPLGSLPDQDPLARPSTPPLPSVLAASRPSRKTTGGNVPSMPPAPPGPKDPVSLPKAPRSSRRAEWANMPWMPPVATGPEAQPNASRPPRKTKGGNVPCVPPQPPVPAAPEPPPKAAALKDLLTMWNSSRIVDELLTMGGVILKSVASTNFRLIENQGHPSSTVTFLPSGAFGYTKEMAQADLLAAKGEPVLTDSVGGFGDDEITRDDFLSIVLDDAADTRQCLACFGIPFVKGERKDLTSTLGAVSDKLVLSKTEWVWTMKGHITAAHMDDWGSQHLNHHVSGTKLWGTWPPTTANMAIFGRLMENMPAISSLPTAINQLEGLELLILKDETTFMLAPNTIHFCLSFTECVHMGRYVRDAQQFSLPIMQWGLDWVTEGTTKQRHRGRVKSEADALSRSLAAWLTLPGHHAVHTACKTMMETLKLSFPDADTSIALLSPEARNTASKAGPSRSRKRKR